jgi:hypothetical protein
VTTIASNITTLPDSNQEEMMENKEDQAELKMLRHFSAAHAMLNESIKPASAEVTNVPVDIPFASRCQSVIIIRSKW